MEKDKDIALAVVKQSGLQLKYFPNSLRSDKDIVEAAVKENVKALRYSMIEAN